ncbi:putative serine protease PepD [Nonomuraea solani]|uniref:Putative serine protease PepD n=1 Tax=Nonomuraea solani TaxID=1144553 RepID=A0A1H6EM98_9ACTN|nr:trypsin-like peptidase domain-containing protein [Nonomuraea solani]SEG97884.1 putative serine protease PepD [Nonomuraea solani]
MDANEPGEQRASGWSQFGDTPPSAGGFAPRSPLAPPPPPPPQRAGFVLTRKAIAGLALAAVTALSAAALGGGAVGAYFAGGSRPVPAVTKTTVPSPVFHNASDKFTVAQVAEKVQPSVVMIQGQSAEGSGVVLSEDGLILTNNHVVAGQSGELTVKFNDGKTAKAKVVGTDPATDLAVIRAEGVSGLAKVTLGDSDQLKVGDDVLAIGSPLGLDGTVTSGIISALDRTVTAGSGGGQQLPPGMGGQEQASETTTLGGMIQTDAAINPGNSGGALVNAAGELVGINSAVASDGVNLGFAIPVNTAKHVSDQLISKGTVSHAYLGVSLAEAGGDVSGALVREVTKGGPAEKAGLKQGDLITKIGNTAVTGGDTVVGQVRGYQVGQQVELTYQRDGKESTVTVTMEEKK